MKTKIVDGERVELSESELQNWKDSNPTLEEARNSKIDRIKEQANNVLSETDWCVVRQQETDESIPQSVIDHRADVRTLSDQFESDVNTLNNVSEVQEYSFEYPDPPEA